MQSQNQFEVSGDYSLNYRRFICSRNDPDDCGSGCTIPRTYSQSPVASPGGPYVALTGASIALDAGGSWSFDGPIIYYYWDFGDGTSGTGPNPTHQYDADGVYTVTLTVCDDLWNCDHQKFSRLLHR